ncbi:diguanylate cyclase [Viridibacterium curvum]|uniref:diguanylate cyclase n=1 Tax=Viridibacterium curvum TaxID=1101404 RepID=A0ABP9QT87_9RHOO
MLGKAALKDLVYPLLGLLLGALAWELTGLIWLALPVTAFGAALSFGRRHQQQARQRRESDRLAASLDDERERHAATRQFAQRLLDVVPMPIYVKDAQRRVIIVNRAQAEQWGLPPETIIGTPSFELVSEADSNRLSFQEDQSVLEGQQIYKEERLPVGYLGQTEERFRVIAKGRCEDTEVNPVIVCSRFDTTDWRLAERKVLQALQREQLLRQRNQEFLQRVLDVIPDPFYIKDAEGRVVLANEAYARDRGHSTASIIGVLATAIAINPELAVDSGAEDAAVLRGETVDKEQRYVMPHSGEVRYRLISKRPVNDMDGNPLIVVAHLDITRWKVAEAKLARLALQDELTGLPNRRHFLQEAERLISSATRHSIPLSLIIIDVDHFKQINDTHGHVIGDLVLRKVAERLLTRLRNEDLPCRWGGEEFAILLPLTDLAMANTVGERLRTAFANEPIEAEGHSLQITLSGGVTQKKDNESLLECLSRADKALYAAKNSGRNCFITA